MQPDRFGHIGIEPPAQVVVAQILMPKIFAAIERGFEIGIEQVTDIVQQRGRDQVGRRPFGFRQGGALKRVLRLGDRLTAIQLAAAGGDHLCNVFEKCHVVPRDWPGFSASVLTASLGKRAAGARGQRRSVR